MQQSLTILIAARDAATTIERAVRSCLGDGMPILLIDDHCTDDTVLRARAVGGQKVRVIRSPDPGGIPVARQAGLDAVDTPYAAWLDADDEWLTGRSTRLLALLQDGADVAVDRIELFDGPSNTYLRTLETPRFIRGHRRPLRLFERNYLPGDTQVAFRTNTFRRAGGYDEKIVGPESFDLLLRALISGATFAYCDRPGYRMFAYPNSVSRSLDRQREAVRETLRKHDYETVKAQCLHQGYAHRTITWILVSMALFREEADTALAFLGSVSLGGERDKGILEPDGPCRRPEIWCYAFFHGTALLLIKGEIDEALQQLSRAEQLVPTAECANNLGVAYQRIGDMKTAKVFFDKALQRFPGYADALINLGSPSACRVTTHPLRQQPSRSEYHHI